MSSDDDSSGDERGGGGPAATALVTPSHRRYARTASEGSAQRLRRRHSERERETTTCFSFVDAWRRWRERRFGTRTPQHQVEHSIRAVTNAAVRAEAREEQYRAEEYRLTEEALRAKRTGHRQRALQLLRKRHTIKMQVRWATVHNRKAQMMRVQIDQLDAQQDLHGAMTGLWAATRELMGGTDFESEMTMALDHGADFTDQMDQIASMLEGDVDNNVAMNIDDDDLEAELEALDDPEREVAVRALPRLREPVAVAVTTTSTHTSDVAYTDGVASATAYLQHTAVGNADTSTTVASDGVFKIAPPPGTMGGGGHGGDVQVVEEEDGGML